MSVDRLTGSPTAFTSVEDHTRAHHLPHAITPTIFPLLDESTISLNQCEVHNGCAMSLHWSRVGSLVRNEGEMAERLKAPVC